MLRQKKLEGMGAAGIAVLLGLFLFSVPSCKSPTSPAENLSTTVTINNGSGADVDVFMDGTFEITVGNGASADVEGVSGGSHLFEAKKQGTEMIVFSVTLDVDTGYAYTLTIEGPAIISISNQYGEDLQLYVEDEYVADIQNNSTFVLDKVPFGTHNLTVKKKSDSTVVATKTFDVTEVKTYTWEIK
jgi:Ca2+-binding RTX toxin-like protein